MLTLAGCAQAATAVKLPQFIQHTPAPPAPSAVSAMASGNAIEPGTWLNQGRIELHVAAAGQPPANLSWVTEAEFVPASQPFSGTPNVQQAAGGDLQAPPMIPGLAYHWQARIAQSDGQASAWVVFPGTIGFETGPVPAPGFLPLPHAGYTHDPAISISWAAASDPAGVSSFAYAVDQQPVNNKPANFTNAATATARLDKDGAWYFHLQAIDGAGNLSPVVTVPLIRDSSPLKLTPPDFSSAAFNPVGGPLDISLKASKTANLRLDILPATSDQPVRSFQLGWLDKASVQWDGKDSADHVAPPGQYRIRLHAEDRTGQTADAVGQDALTVTNKRIVVSLSRQQLWAYQGNQQFLTSLITSGGPELPTPAGVFHILGKFSPFTFHSPWPKGSPLWYPDSPTSYAMLFQDQGYFIHDAPWRGWFGPGSNSQWGTPAGATTGSHGCINAPFGTAQALFGWAPVGTPVIIQN